MKQILLVPGPALSNKMEITVMDFPEGINPDDINSSARKRCKITVEYGRPDVMELKTQGKSFDDAMDYYKNYIYDIVKFHIL